MEMQTQTKVLLLIAAILVLEPLWAIRTDIVADYRFEKKYGQLWELADKSSTLDAKQKYISEFVEALEAGVNNGDFSEYNAVFLKTPNNELKKNIEAIHTLSSRLSEIGKMDTTSFQYNTAIEQITKQEQGGAAALLAVINGCYRLENYPLVWGWIGDVITGGFILAIVVLLCAAFCYEL